MHFQHTVDIEKGLIIIKAMRNVSIREILSEIRQAIASKRGVGIPVRVIDLTKDNYDYSPQNTDAIFGTLAIAAKKLKTQKTALLFKQLPTDFDINDAIKEYCTDKYSVKVFDNKNDLEKFIGFQID